MSFAQLKKNRKKNIEFINESLNKIGKGSSRKVDERIWKPKFDKSGDTGLAVVRFLPACAVEDAEGKPPIVRVLSYSFKDKGYYIENSLSTFDEADPVQEAFSELWNTGIEANKVKAKSYRRVTKYFANVYIEKDTANPDNEGKVFIYEFGAQIYEKLQKCLEPQYADQEKIDPFNLWEGVPLTIRIKSKSIPDGKGGQIKVPNYEDSSFATSPVEIFVGDDGKKEEVWNKAYELQPFLDRKNFKTYDELKAQFLKATGRAGGVVSNGGAGDMMGGDYTQEPKQEPKQETPNLTSNESNNTLTQESQPETQQPMDNQNSVDKKEEEIDPDLAMFMEMANS